MPVTPAGLGDDESPAGVTLETHVAQTTEIVRATSDDEPLVLVDHSYGGSVISGVADRLPDRVSALVYLDAFVPEDGDLVLDDDQRRPAPLIHRGRRNLRRSGGAVAVLR